MAKRSTFQSNDLVKHTLAAKLRAEIVSGTMKPGARIVEGACSRRFGVAQASIREAINILASDGFVTKLSGRSARVVNLSEDDVVNLYELRGALEGLAARVAATKNADVTKLQAALDAMRRAAIGDQPDDLLNSDLQFHLELCDMSGNPYIVEHARKILFPFFAFVRIRVVARAPGTSAWERDLEAHQRIVDLIREGEGDIAEQYVRRAMSRFGAAAYDNWEKRVPKER